MKLEEQNQTSKASFREVYFSSSFTATLAVLLGTMFFVGLYPGHLVTDTIANIHNALNGTYSLIYPPFIEASLGLLFVFDKSLFSIFFLQIFTYWAGVYLLSMYFYKKSIWLTLLVFLVALFPYNIHLHSTLIKDVWLQEIYILFFGITALIANRERFDNIFIFWIFLTGLTVILLRNVFVALILPIGLVISWLLLHPNRGMEYLVRLFGLTLLFSILLWGLGAFFNHSVTNGLQAKRVDNFARLAAYDLFGMSIAAGHKGVTHNLSPEAKEKSTRAYHGNNVFWPGTVGDEAVKFLLKLKLDPDIKHKWTNEILKNPGMYLKHRIHVFCKLFNGTGQKSTELLSRKKNLGSDRFAKSLERIKIDDISPTVVWQGYDKYIRYYFLKIRANWWILILSLSMGVAAVAYTLQKRRYNQDLSLCMLMNLCAWSYFGPYIFMIHHSEVRYVYPGLSLILFSVPFFISFIIHTFFV
jgi:hypothetical protein